MAAARRVRAFLDGLYLVGGVAAALCLVAILGLIVVQMVARWTGEVVPGAPDYAGYFMAAASFLAFAHALNKGAHIRVSIVLNLAGPRLRRALEIWCFSIATALGWYLVYYACRAAHFSWKLGDISQGQDATPLWIPQLGMVIGVIVFAIALTDHLLSVLSTGQHRIVTETVDH